MVVQANHNISHSFRQHLLPASEPVTSQVPSNPCPRLYPFVCSGLIHTFYIQTAIGKQQGLHSLVTGTAQLAEQPSKA